MAVFRMFILSNLSEKMPGGIVLTEKESKHANDKEMFYFHRFSILDVNSFTGFNFLRRYIKK